MNNECDRTMYEQHCKGQFELLSKAQEEIGRDLKEIKNALLGDYEKTGLVAAFLNTKKDLENHIAETKQVKSTWVNSVISSFVSAVIGAAMAAMAFLFGANKHQ